jgi:hypothetical protein
VFESGFEPLTHGFSVHCSTNWAIQTKMKKIGFEPMKDYYLIDLQSIAFNRSAISSLFENDGIWTHDF